MQFRLPVRIFFGEPLSKMDALLEKPKRRKKTTAPKQSPVEC